MFILYRSGTRYVRWYGKEKLVLFEALDFFFEMTGKLKGLKSFTKVKNCVRDYIRFLLSLYKFYLKNFPL